MAWVVVDFHGMGVRQQGELELWGRVVVFLVFFVIRGSGDFYSGGGAAQPLQRGSSSFQGGRVAPSLGSLPPTR